MSLLRKPHHYSKSGLIFSSSCYLLSSCVNATTLVRPVNKREISSLWSFEAQQQQQHTLSGPKCTTKRRSYSSKSTPESQQDYLEYKQFQQMFQEKYKMPLIHLGTKTDYDKSVQCLRYIDDFHSDVMIHGVCLVLIDGKSELGEDLVHVKVSRNILNDNDEEQRFVELMQLLKKVLYRVKMTQKEIIRWHTLRGSNQEKLPAFARDMIMQSKFGIRGRTIFGFYITESDVYAYGVLISAAVTLLAMALYGKYKKRRDMDKAEENYVRMKERQERERIEREKISQMALQRHHRQEEGE